MDTFQVVYHIKKTTKQYLMELLNKNILTKDTSTKCTSSFIFFNTNIYVASESRIIARGLKLNNTSNYLGEEIEKYFDVIFTSYIGHKKLKSDHIHQKISDSMKKRDPYVKDVYGKQISMNSIFTEKEFNADDSDNNLNKSNQCSTSSFGIILEKGVLCMNGPNIRGINMLYCSLVDIDFEEHMRNIHLCNINLYTNSNSDGNIIVLNL